MRGTACIEAFVYPTEDKEKVLKALKTLTSVEPKETSASTRFGGKMLILHSYVTKQEELDELLANTGGVCTPEDNTHIMLSKQRAFLGEVVPGRGLKVSFRLAKR